MRNLILLALLLTFLSGSSQVIKSEKITKNLPKNVPSKEAQKNTQNSVAKATFNQYRIITLQKDTTYVDTSLTIKKEYEYNYLRRDLFGLLPFANEGHTYTVLDYGMKNFTAFPEMGFSGKHFSFLQASDINYYSVATPMTELYFKTVMEQGQSVDALITVNTSEQFNFSAAYRGLRSLGKYINQLSSAGNFRFTASYHTQKQQYAVNFHFTGQDILNNENGGITTMVDFESGDQNFQDRRRLEVYLRDAKTFLKGKRIFFDQYFRLNPKNTSNNIYLNHQFNYENKLFEYNQATVASTIGQASIVRFGESSVAANINDQTRYNRMYNKIGAVYENALIGKFQFFAEDFRYNYFYRKILIFDTGVVPNALSDEINTIGAQYDYRKNNWNGTVVYSSSITNQSLLNLDAKLKYKPNGKNEFIFQYQMINKIPDHIYNVHQSSFVSYNWANDFKNEKINNVEASAKTQWFSAALQISSYDDHLYFSQDTAPARVQLISPKQYSKTINYISAKVSKEFQWRKLAIDNTLLFQQVNQEENILNVPQFVTRNTLYFTDYFFKKALFLQTGFTLNYFSKHYANDYNPITTEAFVQNQTMIGDFPMIDFFINARIKQTRIFVKAEHLNSPFTGNTFFNAPNYPYRDFMVRFGLVWNFFQ